LRSVPFALALHFTGNHRILAPSMNIRVYVLVEGHVQEVGFRYHVYRHAVSRGLSGFVRNLPSGDVELEAEGERSILEKFIADVESGPKWAEVHRIKVEWLQELQPYDDFEIR
jgi:acylphosphatase